MSHGDKTKVSVQKVQRWEGEGFFFLWAAGIFPFRVKILVWFVEVVVWGPSFCACLYNTVS